MTDILSAVSQEYMIPSDVLLAREMRTLPVTHARHVAQYLACTMTFMSKGQIAGCFKQRDHSAVFYSLNKISKLMLTDESARARILRVKTTLTK